ncbi:MAG: SpoIIIAH-like family protein [bacterium]|nr:SpoIIIAH-like family protein [bacterium]
MKKAIRKNQIVITTLAVMIAAAGYLNYAGKEEVSSGEVYEAGVMQVSDEAILNENQASEDLFPDTLTEIASLDDPSEGNAVEEVQNVSSMEGSAGSAETGEVSAGADSVESSETGLENPGEAVLTSGMSVSDYIASAQMSREQIRAKNKDTLLEIINNEQLDEAAKQGAINNMVDMTAIAEKENAAEMLLMAKGFADPVVSITDGQVDVVIHATDISDSQRAQIEDIVKRKTEVTADKIVISLMNLQEPE